MTVDPDGRVTAFAADTGAAFAAAAQGTVASDGQFDALSDDGTLEAVGTVSSTGTGASGTVRRNGQTLFTYTAVVVASGAATASGLTGSYLGVANQGAANQLDVFFSVDATSHGTLAVRTGGATTGALVTVSPSGAIASTTGDLAGQLTVTATAQTLVLTKLNGAATNTTVNLTRSARAKWTFLVFLNGANNLQEFGPLNVNQMEMVGSSSDVNMVVQWKQAQCSDCGNPTWTGTRRYLVKRDSDTTTINSQLLEDMGQNIDMGDWHELRNFIVWAQQRYPANHYALVIWNHGAGWRPTRAERDRRLTPYPRSVSIDDSTNNEIQTWQLPQALNVTPKMDMVVFDASLMQMSEVAYEIRNSSQIVVGSEESPPGEGYRYQTFLADLVANPSMSATDFAKDIVNKTLDSYGPNGNNTQSAIQLSQMDTVASKIDAFATVLLRHTADSAAAIATARTNAENYAYPENKDLYDYAQIIKDQSTSSELQAAATGVQQAITASLLAERHGSGHANSHGLAIYVPDKSGYLLSYSNLALARATAWGTWLQGQP